MISKKTVQILAIGVPLLTLCGGALLISGADSAKAVPKKISTPMLPAPGAYIVDPVHSFAYFGAWHHIVGLVRGRFEKVEGTITVSQDPAACGVDITIDAASISTQNSKRDEDLRGPDFFDAQKFPAMTYHGRGIHRSPSGAWLLNGSLTIRGVTKVVPLTFQFKGIFPDTPPDEPARAAFHATAAAKRAEFGMVRDNVMELGVPPAPGPDVAIEIDVEADAAKRP